MSEILCAGLTAGTPIGFLAALGLFRHADSMRVELGEVKLRWSRRGGGWCAVLVTENEVETSEFIDRLVQRVCSSEPRAEFGWAEQIKKTSPSDFRRDVQANPDLGDWFAAFGCELAVAKDGTLRSTLLDMTGGQQKFLAKLNQGSAALTINPKVAKELLTEALIGPWLYRPAKKAIEWENSHSMGLDPSTQLTGAFTAEEPAAIKDKRGIRGAIWLAFESLPLLPCTFSEKRLRTTRFFTQKKNIGWKTYFEWGVWEHALTMGACKVLLSQSFDEWTRGRGVRERFRSERIKLNKDYYLLGPAELVTD